MSDFLKALQAKAQAMQAEREKSNSKDQTKQQSEQLAEEVEVEAVAPIPVPELPPVERVKRPHPLSETIDPELFVTQISELVLEKGVNPADLWFLAINALHKKVFTYDS